MAEYHQVYQAVPRLLLTLGGLIFGLGFVFVGVGIFRSGRDTSSLDPSKRPAAKVFGSIFVLFSVLWSTAVGAFGFSRWLAIREGLDNEKFHAVTGQVKGLDMTLERYPSAWFSVAGKKFRFHGAHETSRFRGSQETWPVQPEQEVRVTYACTVLDRTCFDPIFLRVEVRDKTEHV